jgi:hypothetical protein
MRTQSPRLLRIKHHMHHDSHRGRWQTIRPLTIDRTSKATFHP